MLKKIIFKNILVGLSISIGFCGGVFLLTKAASLTATTGNPLTAGNWNDMVKNFFWGSGSGGIYYNGKVGIGTNAPNKNLHIYDTDTNAEIDLQSVAGTNKHWAIYQDKTNSNLYMWSNQNNVAITSGGNMDVLGKVNGIGGICMNGDCKTSWAQVGGTVSAFQFTGTSVTCDSSNGGKVKYTNGKLYLCNGIEWIFFAGKIYMELYNGARRWEDGTYASSCNGYKNPSGIYSYGGNTGDGDYRITVNGITDKVYCDMTTQGGGRTLSMNLDTNDGNVKNYDSAYWYDLGNYGAISSALTSDYKSKTSFSAAGSEFMLKIHQEGSTLAYKTYLLNEANKSLYYFFNKSTGVQLTASTVTSSGIASLNTKEPTISQDANLRLSTARGSGDYDRVSIGGTITDNMGGGLGTYYDAGYAQRPYNDGQLLNCSRSASAACTIGTDIGSNCLAARTVQSGLQYDYAFYVR